jgi:DnaJ-class molecular chaperone
METGEIVAQRHQIRCPDCAGSQSRAFGVDASCRRCHGAGRVGNCQDCGGSGLITASVAGQSARLAGLGPQAPSNLRSCCTCRSIGWIGNCPTCHGHTVLVRPEGYNICRTCEGHGHLHRDLYGAGEAKFAAIVRVNDTGRFFVTLDTTPTVFGRWPAPYAHVRLADPLVTKRHFEIDWNASSSIHEVNDYGRYSLTLNGRFLAGTSDRARLHSDASWEGDRRSLSLGDVLQIGQYTLEYVALRDEGGKTAG